MTNREWEKIEKEFDKLYYNRVCRGNHHQPMSGCFCIVKDFFRQKLEEREKEILKELKKYQDALIWCSGSEDFQVGGKARRGWEKICQPLLRKIKK